MTIESIRPHLKKIIGMVLLVGWMVFSVVYVANDQWQDFKVRQIQLAYQRGLTDSMRRVMIESAKGAPITLTDGENRVEIISTEALRLAQLQSQTQETGE